IARAGAKPFENWGPFVMTMERALYMAWHFNPSDWNDSAQQGVFHTAYTAGEPVLMAGTMLIDNGIIRGIRSDSGHYLPTLANMTACLNALTMYAVDLNQIRIYDWTGTNLGTAPDFLRTGMTWKNFESQHTDERQHRMDSDKKREEFGLNKRFPHIT